MNNYSGWGREKLPEVIPIQKSFILISGAQSDDDLYESIYEVVNPPHGNHIRHPRRSYDDFDSESEFDEIIEEDEYQVNNNQVTINNFVQCHPIYNDQASKCSFFYRFVPFMEIWAKPWQDFFSIEAYKV